MIALKKEHFRVAATKDGQPYEIDVHRDGKIVEHTPFSPEDAAKLSRDNGYELIGEPRPVGEHFELLGKQDGKYTSCKLIATG